MRRGSYTLKGESGKKGPHEVGGMEKNVKMGTGSASDKVGSKGGKKTDERGGGGERASTPTLISPEEGGHRK